MDNPQSIHPNEVSESSKDSWLSRIKNFFSKKANNAKSYDVKDLVSPKEEPAKLLSLKQIRDDLPLKSDDVQSEQHSIVQQQRYDKEEAKFASKGEIIPPRVPLENTYKPSVSDKQDLKDSLDIFRDIASEISFHHAVDVAKSISKNPVFKKTLEDPIGKRQLEANFNFYLSEIRSSLPSYPETIGLQTSLNNTYKDLNDRILNNNRIKETIENSSFSKKDDFKIIFKEVMNEYREAFKANMGFDFGDTSLKVGDKYKSAHFNPRDEKSIYVPKPKQFKDEYMFLDSSNTEVGLMALETAVHEMTHKQQDFFVENKNNPQFDQSMKDYALLLDLNRRFYQKGAQNFNLYKTQIIEKEAFTYGEETARSFQATHNIASRPIRVAPQNDLLKISGASPNADPSTQNVFSMLPSKKILNHLEGSSELSNDRLSSLDNPQSIHPNEVSQESQKPKLPPKSDYVISEQLKIALKNNPIAAPYIEQSMNTLNQKRKNYPSESDIADVKDFMERGLPDLANLTLAQSGDILETFVHNKVFKLAHQNDLPTKQKAVLFATEAAELGFVYPDSLEYQQFSERLSGSIEQKILNDPDIMQPLIAKKIKDEQTQKQFVERIRDRYLGALKEADLSFSVPEVKIIHDKEGSYYSIDNDTLNMRSYDDHMATSSKQVQDEIGFILLNETVHEMTHKQQKVFAQNIKNPDISEGITNYFKIIDANNKVYYEYDLASGAENGAYYRNQFVESEAYDHGSKIMNKALDQILVTPSPSSREFETLRGFKSNVKQKIKDFFRYKKAQDAQNDLREEPYSESGEYSLLNSPLKEARKSLDTSLGGVSFAMLPDNQRLNQPEPTQSLAQKIQSIDSNNTSQGSEISWLSRIKNLFSKKANNAKSYDVKELVSPKEEPAKLLSLKQIRDDLPLKSDDVQSEQYSITQQQRYDKEEAKFASKGKIIPPRVPLEKQYSSSLSDIQDLNDFFARGLAEAKNITLHRAVDILKSVSENPVFEKNIQNNAMEYEIKSNFISFLSEVGNNLSNHFDAKDPSTLIKNVNANLENRILNNVHIKDAIQNFSFKNEKSVRTIFGEVAKEYTEAFKDIAGLDFGETSLYVSKDYPAARYSHFEDSKQPKGIHIPSPKKFKEVYLENDPSKNQIDAGLMALNIAVHEINHKQQYVLMDNTNNPNFTQSTKDYIKLLTLNNQFYLLPTKDYNDYKNQLMENEAFLNGTKIAQKFKDLHIPFSQASLDSIPHSSPSSISSFFPSNRDSFPAMLARPQARLDSLKEASDTMQIIHTPILNPKNLESFLEGAPSFSNVSLVYGIDLKRNDLLINIPESEMKKRPLIGDDYIDSINPYISDKNAKRFYDFAASVARGNPDLMKIEIIQTKTSSQDPRDLGTNSIPDADNRKILDDLLGDRNVVEILKNIDVHKNAMETIKQIAKDQKFNELSFLMDNTFANDISKLNAEEKHLYNLYLSHVLANDEERFFAAKTTSVLKNVLDSGGKIYFNLDVLVTSDDLYTGKITDVDITRLKNIFDPKNEYYDSVTSQELRYVYEKYRHHPGLKFTIEKQVIQNPFTLPEVIEAIENQVF